MTNQSESESQLIDMRITQAIVDFASTLERKYHQELVEIKRAQVYSLAEHSKYDPDYMPNVHFNEGSLYGMRLCFDILQKLVDAEVKDMKMRLGDSKKK